MKKKRQEIHWSTLNARWALQKAILYFTAFIRGLISNHRGSTGPAEHFLRTTCLTIWPPMTYATVLIRFPIIAQRSEGTNYFHRVV